MRRNLLLVLSLLVLLSSACGASAEEQRLAFLLENPMASASLPFGELFARAENEGDFDPIIGNASGSSVSTTWEIEEDQVLDALQILIDQAEVAGFEVELTTDGTASGLWGYDGVSTDLTRISIDGSGPTDLFPARVSVSLR